MINSPAQILQRLMIQSSGLVTLYTKGKEWPCSFSAEPSKPDNSVTLYDTSGLTQGRLHVSGEVPEFYGIQVRVRAVDFVTGYAKIAAIVEWLDQTLYEQSVTIEGETYTIHSATRQTTILPLGKDREGNSDRYLFTVNYLISLR